MRPLPPLSDAGHQAVTVELIRLTLPHHPTTSRPELETPIPDGHLTDQRRTPRPTRRRSRR